MFKFTKDSSLNLIYTVAILFVIFISAFTLGQFRQTDTESETVPMHVSSESHALSQTASQPQTPSEALSANQPSTSNRSPTDVHADISFSLETAIANGQLVFIGVGGNIDGIVNPDLHVAPGDTVQINLINGDGAQHDLAIPEYDVKTDFINAQGASSVLTFRAEEEGTFEYLCTVPGHKAAGMFGQLIVGDVSEEENTAPSISRDPADLPAPLTHREPVTHDLDISTIELEGHLADGTSYRYWTFDGQVPGPFLRVRVGDDVNVTLRNDPSSTFIHSIDFHAVTGPGGGAAVTQTSPGQETRFSFKALNPGLYVYHCATPSVAHHISSGMYGLILVEPEEGLAEVDHEFYVMQGELYTLDNFGKRGLQEFDFDKMLDERAEYLVFNGATDALTTQFPMNAQVGERVRIFFGVGGPNYTSSLHMIGEIFDRVHPEGATNLTFENVQTTLVPAGGATMVEFDLEVPGRYILVDHSLSRLERGLVGFLYANGEANPDVFEGVVQENSGH